MRKKAAIILCLILLLAVDSFPASPPTDIIKTDTVTVTIEQQYESVRPGAESAFAIHFQLAKDWHFYASAKTAPGGMNLKLKPSAEKLISFSEPIFPPPIDYFDEFSGQKLDVFSDKFTVFLPFSIEDFQSEAGTSLTVNIDILGAICSKTECRMPDFDRLSAEVKIDITAVMDNPGFALPDLPKASLSTEPAMTGRQADYSALGALILALLAGLSLNIMPCVWPVLPIIVMRLVEQAKQSKGKSVSLGLTFCLGILLFFACLAAANIILQLFYGTVLQWGDPLRIPSFVMLIAFVLIVLALFMFGVFTIVLPSSVAGKSGSQKGYAGAVGMGFLAAILSTPCSFAILAAAFAWAQAQPLPVGTIAIMFIGIGMALPYAILTSIPALLKNIPRPGQWMELFKQAIGFVLLIIAVKLIAALPQVRRMDVLYFAVVLSFCAWMWGSWVGYNTKPVRKWLIRMIAVILAIFAGRVFLPAPTGELIDWQKYDSASIQTALTNGRPVLIKFTADWCLVCQAVDKIVYSREDIAKLLEQKNVLTIKADTTVKDYHATLALKNIYNEPGVPVTVLFTPGKIEPVRWRNMFFADELKSQLDQMTGK